MNRTLAAITVLLLLGGCCGGDIIWKTDTFSLTSDGVIQKEGEYRASAPDSRTLLSNYPEADIPEGRWALSRDISRFASYQAPTRF
jgi:hypothetical protein